MDPTLQQALNLIHALEAEVARLRTIVDQPPTSRPKSRLPDPEKFNGGLRWDTWLPLIQAKLRIDRLAIGPEPEALFFYVYGNLDSRVQAIVLPQLRRAEATESWDPQSILDQLARVYDDPNKAQKAADRLHSLRQGDDSFPTFLAKFERLLYEAGADGWPDSAKISALRNGVSKEIRGRLAVQLAMPATYTEFLKAIQQLAGLGAVGKPPTSAPPGNKPPSDRRGDPMEIGAITVGNPIDDYEALEDYEDRTYGTNHVTIASVVTAQRAINGRADSTTPEQRQQWRKEGRCVRCGKFGHWAKHCYLNPAKDADDDGVSSTSSAF